jgi:dTDP-4-amino-4,6-dideoxygalactose transaminase
MDALMEIGRRYGIAIIEDAAHCTGAEWSGKKIGNVGDITCFSLQGMDPHGKPVSGGEGGIVTTNNRELYERLLIYCHLHRAGVTKELTNPEYRRLDPELLGLKWRAHPLALALAKVSLSTLEYRNKCKIENRERIFKALKDLPGLKPISDYEKAKPAGFYGGLKIKYHQEQLGNLSIDKFVEAVKAEGAPISATHLTLEHLRSIFTRGFDLWGHDRGPLGSDFKVYKRGDFPIAESFVDKVLTIPAYIEQKEGFLDQYIEAFNKVITNYKSLLK